MKMLKKAGAIAIAGAMVMSLGTISAFAEGEATTADPIVIGEDITINPVLNEAGEKTGVLEVTVPYTVNASGVDQVTLLAEFGDSEAFTNKIDYTTTAYIDQKADDSKAFTFKINENRLIPEGTTKNVYLNVKIGGNGVAKAAEGHKEAYKYVEPEVPTTPITNEEIKGALEVKDGATVIWTVGNVNAGIMRLPIDTLIADNKLDLATQKVTIDGNETRYTVYNGVTKLVALVDTAIETHEIKVVSSTEENPVSTKSLKYGDATLNDLVNSGDITAVADKILAGAAMTSLEDFGILAADYTGNQLINSGDITGIADGILNPSNLPGAAK